MQNLIAGLIVFSAVAYAAWRYTPAAWKRQLARMLGASERQAQKISTTGACGSCNSCKSCATPAERSQQVLHMQK